MFLKRETVVVNDRGLLENIKRDIENKLNEKGVMILGINIETNTENISLIIHIRCLPQKTRQLL